MVSPMTMVVMVLLLFFYQVSKVSSYLVILALHANDWLHTVSLIMKMFITVIVMLPFKLSLVLFSDLLLLCLFLCLTACAYSCLYLPCHGLIQISNGCFVMIMIF